MRRGFVVSGSLVAAALMLGACSSGGSSAKGSTTDPSAHSPAGLLSSAELSTLVSAAAKQRFKVAYKDGSGDTLRYAQDGQGNTMQATGDSESLGTPTSTILCDKSGGAYQCTETPGASGPADNPFTSVVTLLQSYLSGLGGNVGTQSSKTIAGRAAQCLTFSAQDLAANATGSAAVTDPKVSATYCIDTKTGATLEVSATDASGTSSTSLEVTDFTTPSASDFVPPATPTPAAG
jgi:hypothetical protein